MGNQELERREELEVVTTAFFLEERLKELQNQKESLQLNKPAKPSVPVEPKLEHEEITPITYPDVSEKQIQVKSKWKKCLVFSVVCIIVAYTLVFATFNTFFGFLGVAGFWGGIICALVLRKKEKAEREEKVQEILNSAEYKQKCKEIDEQNRKNQKIKDEELHNKYVERYQAFEKAKEQYANDIKEYNEYEIPAWEEENTALSLALSETKDVLQSVYDKNIIPFQYRRIEALAYLASFLNTSRYDLKEALTRYDNFVTQLNQQKQISLAEAQLEIMQETLQNQQYANWLNEQTLNMAEQGNDILNSIGKWQKADIAYRTYTSVKDKRAMKKAMKKMR